MKRRHLKTMTDRSTARHMVPDITGTASARYENMSHGGTTWFDLMPAPANGTDSGGIAWPDFGGLPEYISIGQPAKLNFGTTLSVVAWGSQDADSSQGYERLISRDNGGARSFILSQKDTDGNPFAAIFIGGGTIKSIAGTGDYADGNWHHYVVTHDGATLRLYIDGSLEGDVAAVGTIDNDAVDWEVGREQNNTDYLEGRCDTTRFYARALSADEILRDYNAGKPAHP